jgi:anti-sigma B factor antagonist
MHPSVVVNVDVSSTAVVATVTGELDMATAPDAVSTLGTHLGNAKRAFVVDLRPVTFFGSVGMAMLLQLNAQAADLGVRFVVVADHSIVLRPLKLTALDDVLVVCPDLDVAYQNIS